MEDLHGILKKYWGYSDFRPLQEDIINQVISGKDTLALLPTGGGKSICFQVPAMAQEGLCLVVSPLIALMKDQVENLNKKGIKAMCIISGMHPKEIDRALDNCAYGDVKFLYVSPERLASELFLTRLHKMKVNLLAVDEAHCVSQWGYDFRPAYLRIAEVRKHLPKVPVLALTATATKEVVQDIQEKLRFPKPNLLQKSFERKNLAYVVLPEENKMSRLLKVMENVPGSGLVYVRTRKKTREISDFLNENGIKADYYHAGLDNSVRDQKQKNWIDNRCRVIVATNAFGMGIDKPDVRFVVHLDLPDSIEGYFQEAGRAGRDGAKAYAILLYREADQVDLKDRLNISFPEIDEIRRIYQALANFYRLAIGSGEGQSYPFELTDFASNYNLKPIDIFHSLKFLEREGYLSLSESLFLPSRVMIKMDNKSLYEFQVANVKLDPYLKLLLRSYTGLFDDYVGIREGELARRAGISKKVFVGALKKLAELLVIEYLPQTRSPHLNMIRGRVDAKDLGISKEHYAERKKKSIEQAESVVHYVCSEGKCRQQLLLQYFGETETNPCGVCEVCLKRNKLNLSNAEFEKIRDNLKEKMKAQTLSLKALVELGGQANEKKTLKVIRWMVDNGGMTKDEEERYTWVNP